MCGRSMTVYDLPNARYRRGATPRSFQTEEIRGEDPKDKKCSTEGHRPSAHRAAKPRTIFTTVFISVVGGTDYGLVCKGETDSGVHARRAGLVCLLLGRARATTRAAIGTLSSSASEHP